MMETCARIDSISERQLPWVNGGVYPIRAPPLLHSSSFCRRAPIIAPSLLQVVLRLMASAAHSTALASLYESVSCLTGFLCLSLTFSFHSSYASSPRLSHCRFSGSIILHGCPYISLSTCWAINHPSAGRMPQLENISSKLRSGGKVRTA